MRRVVEKQFWVWSEGPAATSHGLVHFHTALLKVDQRHMVSTAACLGKPGSWMDQDHWSKWSKSLFFFGSLFGLFTFFHCEPTGPWYTWCKQTKSRGFRWTRVLFFGLHQSSVDFTHQPRLQEVDYLSGPRASHHSGTCDPQQPITAWHHTWKRHQWEHAFKRQFNLMAPIFTKHTHSLTHTHTQTEWLN